MRSSYVLIFTVLLMVVLVVMMLAQERRNTMFEVSRLVPPPAAPPPCPDAEENPLPCPDWGVRRRFPRRVQMPEIVHRVEPAYTDAAREHRAAGMVILEIGVRRDGTVGGVCALKPLGCGLTRAAVDAVRQWRFAKQEEDVVTTVTVPFLPPGGAPLPSR